jgi:hypothetical protein
LREGVLTLGDGRTLPVEKWGDEPEAVAKALYDLCAQITFLQDDDNLPSKQSTRPTALNGLDFDSSFFSDTGGGPDDFDRFAEELIDYGEVYLKYDRHGTPSMPWHRLVSGSYSRPKSARSWAQRVRAEALEFYPGLPNQATLVSVRMGFPLFKLKRIKEWKRHYDAYLVKG